MSVEPLETAVSALLAGSGRNSHEFVMEPLSASGNNRVFSLVCGDEKMLLKWYFHAADDSRNRLEAEYSFLEHAWSIGLRCIPKPLFKDQFKHLAVYEFIEGEQIDPSQVDATYVEEAAHFLSQLNSSQSRLTASTLAAASEACFSISAHLNMVGSRLTKLEQMPIETEVDKTATEFVKYLTSFWQCTKREIISKSASLGLGLEDNLTQDERCLSPSDFGFHNALVRPDDSLCFIDFEYAGWDDPAKSVGDFFSHPGIAVPRDQFDSFLNQVLAPFEKNQLFADRVRLLEPVFQVKWCCIILNEFLPAAAQRRKFANPGADSLVSKERQLQKAISRFDSLQLKG